MFWPTFMFKVFWCYFIAVFIFYRTTAFRVATREFSCDSPFWVSLSPSFALLSKYDQQSCPSVCFVSLLVSEYSTWNLFISKVVNILLIKGSFSLVVLNLSFVSYFNFVMFNLTLTRSRWWRFPIECLHWKMMMIWSIKLWSLFCVRFKFSCGYLYEKRLSFSICVHLVDVAIIE